MCQKQVGWDDPLPDDQQEDWKNWIKDLELLKHYNIPRCLFDGLPPGNSPVAVELHSFADASYDGIGQCTYIKLIRKDGTCTINLVMSKSKVPPQRVTTIPRMELTAAERSYNNLAARTATNKNTRTLEQ